MRFRRREDPAEAFAKGGDSEEHWRCLCCVSTFYITPLVILSILSKVIYMRDIVNLLWRVRQKSRDRLEGIFFRPVGFHRDIRRGVASEHLRNALPLPIDTQDRFANAQGISDFIPHTVRGRAHLGDQRVGRLDPGDVARINGVTRPPKIPGQSPLPLPRREKKGPLNVWEIEGRAFLARMLPTADSASGFFYFQTEYKTGSRLYLNGVKDAASGKDYFYFEVPIEKQ